MARKTLTLTRVTLDEHKVTCYKVEDDSNRTLGFVTSKKKGLKKRWGFTLTESSFRNVIRYPYGTKQEAVEKLVQMRLVKADTSSITVVK